MKKTFTVLILATFILSFSGMKLNSESGRDFEIIKMWTTIRSGDVHLRVRFSGQKPFNRYVYFGIWFNNGIKRPVKKKLVFTNNNTFDLVLCNYSHLRTNSGQGELKVKVDVTSQYPETDERNNVYQKVVRFSEVSKIELTADPFKCSLTSGKIKKIVFTGKVTFKGRGTGLFEYTRHYVRSRIKPGQLGYVLLDQKKSGPFSFYFNLGESYSTKTQTFSWYKIESYDNRTRNGEKHQRSYKAVSSNPTSKESNKAIWIVTYYK